MVSAPKAGAGQISIDPAASDRRKRTCNARPNRGQSSRPRVLELADETEQRAQKNPARRSSGSPGSSRQGTRFQTCETSQEQDQRCEAPKTQPLLGKEPNCLDASKLAEKRLSAGSRLFTRCDLARSVRRVRTTNLLRGMGCRSGESRQTSQHRCGLE